MASQEEDNKLECISNVNKEQERYYLNVYKKYDSILNDKTESFEKKVTSLIEVWSSISELNLTQFDIRYVIQIIDWAKLHALNIVLTGEWRSTKDSFRNSLLEGIEKAQSSLATVNDAFSSRCQKLADVVKKPWEDPVLANLIQEKDVDIGSKEIEFFCVETAYLVSVRLKKLCENHCEDLALNLVTNFLKYKKLATVKNFNLNATETQLWFIFDIYVALLYKFQNKTKILEQFEELQLDEGVLLIKRFAKKRVKISKIWRNCHKIAIFGSRFFMSRALMKYTEEYKTFLTDLLKTYLGLSNTETLLQEFVVSVRNITNLADAAGLCVMCEVIHREAADKLRVFAIEMYIRALTTDMNELERLKHVNEEDKVKSTTSRLSRTFTNLADLLDAHVKVARECVLTAFSLEPTKERLRRIEDLARRSGFPVLDTGQEWKCRLHPPILPSDDLAWVCPECGEWMCKPELTAPLQMNMALHEALQESVLGISEALCDDLVVCLSNPRYQILSWLLSWGDLYRLCILYLNDPEKTKNFVTELKFVDVDYSMFEHIKREPVDEFTGIEKGYEQYLDLDFVSDEETSSVSEDSMSHDRSVGLGSDGAGEPYLPLPQAKSDPVTLKSLRMFRPNLKRKKEDSDSSSADKKSATQVATSSTSLGSYLSSSQYKPQPGAYCLKMPTTNTVCTIPNTVNKTPLSSIYLPQAAGATKPKNTSSNLSQVSAAGSNFSAFGYSSTYAAKPFELPKQSAAQSRSNFDQVDSRIQTSFSSNVSPVCYPAKVSEGRKNVTACLSASAILQPENSVFNTTNLSSASSTSYVSNIIKSTLSYGVPKVTVTGSTYASAVPCETITNSNSFGALGVTKQNLYNTPKQQSTFSASNHNSQKTTSPHQTSYTSPNASSPKILSQQGAFTLHSSTFQKTAQQVTSAVPDLDSLLNEIETNKFETESKNGVAATLLQLGGQVAKNQKQLIQVSQQSNLNQIPTKLPQETSLPNGTKKECKMKLKNSTKPDNPSILGEVSEQAMEPPCKQRKLTHESNNQDRTSSNLPGKTIFKIMDLQVKIPKMKLENYKADTPSPIGTILEQTQPALQIQKVYPITQGSSITKPLKIPIISPKSPQEPPPIALSKIHYPLETLKPTLKLSVPLIRHKQLQALKPEHLTLPQDKSPLQTELPAMPAVHHQTKTAAEQESPILTCPKGPFFMPQEVVPHQEATIPTALHSQHPPERQLRIVLNREYHPAPRRQRLESVIIVPPVKAREIISQALLQQHQDNKPLFEETVSKLPSASISLVKSQGIPETTSTFRSLLKAGANRQFKISSQFTDKKQAASQKKCPATCTLADSLKITIPITVDCDKDKMVQIDNQKTDIEMSEVEDITFSAAKDNSSCCGSQISLKKTDEQVSIITEANQMAIEKTSLEEISKDRKVSNTQNINDSIVTNSDLTSDNIRLESEAFKDNNGNITLHNSNNEDDIRLTDDSEEMSLKDDQAKNGIKLVDIVNNKTDCDRLEKNSVQINIETNNSLLTSNDDSKPVKGAKTEKNSPNAMEEKVKFTDILSGKGITFKLKQSSEDVGMTNDKTLERQLESKLEVVLERYEGGFKSQNIFTGSSHKRDDNVPAKKLKEGAVCAKDLEVVLERYENYAESGYVFVNSSDKADIGIPTKESKKTAIYTMDSEIQIAENIVMAEDIECIQESDMAVEIDAVPTVKEIKENILQSMRNQEVIKSKTVVKKKYHKCGCKEDVKIKIESKEPYKYVKYVHNYCGGPKVPPKTSKPVAKGECSPKRLRRFWETSPSPPKSRNNTLQLVLEHDAEEMREHLLFTDSSSEADLDLNKENIKVSSDGFTSYVNSSEDLDEGATCNNKNTTVTATGDISFDFSHFSSGFQEKPVRKSERTNSQNIKKYSNTHKRKHENVPCFKLDQEKSSCNNKSRNSNSDNFETKELSVVLKRLPHSMNKRVQRTAPADSIAILQQRLRETIRDNAGAPICVLYNKQDKPISPLVDLNVGNQVKKKRVKKQKSDDYIRNAVKKGGGISKKRPKFPKDGILKKKSNFPKKCKTERHVRFNLKPQVFHIEESDNEKEEGIAESMLKNVPGLNDFSEVRPHNMEHVVNVVQVSGSRSSTVTNQNTQTSTQVTPHIQRIGQPKQQTEQISDHSEEKAEQSGSSSATSSSSNSRDSLKPTPQTPLINLFGGQIKPGQKCSGTSRQAPFINILSQQILKQPGKPACLHQNKTSSNHLNKSDHRPVPAPFGHDKDVKTAVVKVEPEENTEVQASKSINTNVKIVTSTTQACGAAATATTSTQGGTILQFICKSSSLPKFQQAFGKTVYQTNSSNEGATIESAETSPSENFSQTAAIVDTKKMAKGVPVNVQPITGNVIFRGQVPVGQTVSLIPPGSNTRQLFRITGSTHEQISLVKETVIQNKMSALLAAALQGKPKITEQNGELVEEYSATRITLCRPGTVPSNATRIVKPVQLQIPANVIRAPQPNLSSTTLEQLREFDMVYKQVKERSSNPAQPETTAQSSQECPQQQRISFTYVNQVQKYTQLSPVVVVSSYSPIQQTVSPALTVTSQAGTGACLTQASTVAVPKVAVKTSKGKNIKSTATKTSPAAVPTIPKPQQKPQEDEHTTQRIFDILAEYAEQLRNSPDLNNKPAPRRRSNPPTNPSSSTSGSSSSKKKKKKSNSSTTSNLVETDNEDLTMGSEDSSGGNIVQLSMTDEEHSQSASITPPETNLEPATSNTPTSRSLIVTDSSNQPRNVIIADSSVGEALKMPNTALIMPGSYIMPVSVVKGGQQIAVVSGGSKILTTVPARSGQNMLLFQSFVNQNKKGGISAVKYSTIQPFSSISSQNVACVSSQPSVVLPSSSVATVALGQPITLKKLEDNERGNTELLLTISPPREAIKVEQSSDIPQPDSSTCLSSDSIQVKIEEGSQSDSSCNEVFNTIQKTNSVATSVIASVVKKEEDELSENSTADTSSVKVKEPCKQAERIGSVLVNASTSNGPMLSHTNPRYRKPAESVESTTAPTKEFNHNVTKAPPPGTKIFKNNAIYYAIRTKKAVGKKIDSEMQKQAAMEREIRLQKSLSEECEDLGVDEPSTSDLFPEADLLFDSNHSPSYDHTGQRIQVAEVKAKASMNLFSDDENSGPMRNDLFDYVEYHHPSEAGVDQMNGNNTSNQSASSSDDTTLLPNCGTMSEVTLNSPISPEYTDSSHAVNKYKYKYTNRKKGEKAVRSQIENWSEVPEVTSTADTIEIAKEEEEEETPIAIQEETVIDESVTEIETIIEGKLLQEKEFATKCPVHGSIDARVSRKTMKKTCSCYNGSKSPTGPLNAKRRLGSPKCQTPTPSKKPLLSKKR